jgi:hypothetical protein
LTRVRGHDRDALEDTLELLSDPDALKEIDEARGEIAGGHVVDSAALRAKYLARRAPMR